MKAFDIFGQRISLRMQGKQVYRTNFGLILTIGLILMLTIRVNSIIQSVIDGTSPKFLYQERLVQDPKKFQINNSTFAFTIGFKDTKQKYYKDQKLFKFTGSFYEQVTYFNETTQKKDVTYKETIFDLVECVKGNFDSFNFQQNELGIANDNHYCFPQNLNLAIEGSFYSDNYKDISIFLNRCKGSDCYNETYTNFLLDNHYVDMMLSDTFVVPEQKNNPFKFYLRNMYWPSSQNSPKTVSVNLRNSYVESDFGWFSEDITQDIYPTFSYSDWQAVDKARGYIFKVAFRFEKSKENLYKRSYKKAIDIASELGGFSSGLIALLTVICTIYSQVDINKQLIDKTFCFAEMNGSNDKELNQSRKSYLENPKKELSTKTELWKSQINKNDFQSKSPFSAQNSFNEFKGSTPPPHPPPSYIKSDQNIAQPHLSKQKTSFQEQKVESNSNFNSQNLKEKEIICKSQKEIRKSIIFNSKNLTPQKPDIHKQIEEIIKQTKGMYLEKSCLSTRTKSDSTSKNFVKKLSKNENSFKELLQKTENKQISFSLCKYLTSFFCRTRKYKNEKQILDESINLLYEHLDVSYIINKLIEVDKLKKLFLDQDQITLMEYLPKPVIGYSYDEKNQLTLHQQQYDAIFINKLSPLEKAQKANQSFENILKKKQLSRIDQKIIQMIDQKFKFLFKDHYEAIANQLSPNFEEMKFSCTDLYGDEYNKVFSENFQIDQLQTINNNYNMESVIKSNKAAQNQVKENKS